jgi:serine/threonine-protein kinase
MPQEIPEVGTLLSDRYRLLEAVARGGSGHVFRAESTVTGAPLAVKWIPDPDPEALAKEIHHTIAPRHRNIVPLLDVGEHAGIPFLVCPWLDGGTLRAHPPEDWPETLSILEDVLAGLSYGHSWGILHCDVKPENILFGDGRWQVTDFGISHTMNVPDPSGRARGTPIYAAPEIITHDRSIQRPWTDL